MSVNNSESLLLALTKRLLLSRVSNDPSSDDLQLLVGQLPRDLPIELPLPQNCQLLGSLVVRRRITVVFDTEDASEQIFRFYRKKLSEQGWQEFEYLSKAGGFQEVTTNRRLFCRGEREPALIIYAFDLSERPTQVRLVLELDTQHSPCAVMLKPSNLPKLLPDLISPPQATYRVGSTRQGKTDADSQATLELETNLTLLDVSAHYEAQLSEVWMLNQSGHDGPLAWSLWSFNQSGQESRGVFVVLRTQENPQQYFLFVRANF